MSEIHLLGISQDTITIIFDLIKEMKKVALFKLYPNINKVVEPYTPNFNVDYRIMPLDKEPDANCKVFFGVGGPKNKEAIFNYFFKKYDIGEDRFDQAIHSSAYIASSSNIEKGVLIEPHVVVSSQSIIGFGVFIKRGSLIGHHNTIGDFTDINPGVIVSGKVKIGKGCVIGTGAVIKDNITIGEYTTIGIGSVVTKNIPSNCIAYGNPCRVIEENEI